MGSAAIAGCGAYMDNNLEAGENVCDHI